jgi:hypothetical protein
MHAATTRFWRRSTLLEIQKENAITTNDQQGYFTATFLPNTPSFTLTPLPPPDLTFLPVKPSALSLFVFGLESLAANFTCFPFAGRSTVKDLSSLFGDLRIDLVSEGLLPCDPDPLGVGSSGDGFDSADFCETAVLEGFEGETRSSGPFESKKSIAAARTGFAFTLVGSSADGGFFVNLAIGLSFTAFDGSTEVTGSADFNSFEGADSADEESGLERETGADFFVTVSDFFFFFTGPPSDSRARFLPSVTSSSTLSGIGTRVKPSHLPPSSSSSLQVHTGRLALELVLMCID